MSTNDQVNSTGSNDTLEDVKAKLKGKTGPKLPELQEVTVMAKLIGRGKKPVQPEEVQKLAALGCKNREIANFFGVEESNISRHFADELAVGREEMKITLRKAMLNNACQNNNAALQIFLAKNFLGMADSPIDSEENAPLPWEDSYD